MVIIGDWKLGVSDNVAGLFAALRSTTEQMRKRYEPIRYVQQPEDRKAFHHYESRREKKAQMRAERAARKDMVREAMLKPAVRAALREARAHVLKKALGE